MVPLMLCRPYLVKSFLGIKVPFAPDIIPKEKGRISGTIGGTICKNLINKEVMEKNLLSEEMIGKIRPALDRFFGKRVTIS